MKYRGVVLKVNSNSYEVSVIPTGPTIRGHLKASFCTFGEACDFMDKLLYTPDEVTAEYQEYLKERTEKSDFSSGSDS